MRIKNSAGFTLIETIVYAAILLLVAGTIVNLLLWVFRSNIQVRAAREVEAGAQAVMNQLTQEIRAAKSIYTPTTNASQLSLETTNNLPPGESSTYIDFFLCGERVCVKRESQPPQALTSEEVRVTNLQFEEVATGSLPSVQITLDIEHVNPSNKQEYEASMSLVSAASLRAY